MKPAEIDAELIRLNAELQAEYALLMAAQMEAVAALLASQRDAAAALERSQMRAHEALRTRHLTAVGNLPANRKTMIVDAFDSALCTLREMQAGAAELLMGAQKESATLVLESTAAFLDSRIVV